MRIRSAMRYLAIGVMASATLNCGEAQEQRESEQLGKTGQPVEVIYPADIQSAALLGQGRNLVTESNLPAQCLSSPNILKIPLQSSSIRLDSAMLQNEASEMLGFKVDAKAHFKLLDASAKANFSRSAESKSLSISLYYVADYNFEVEELDQSTLQWNVAPSRSDFLQVCGDQFAWRRQRGGMLMLLYRIDFATEKDKQDFEASVNVSATGAGSVNSSVETHASRFRGKAAVHVEALQVGGDVAALSSFLGGSSSGDGRTAVDCNMDNLAACGQLMSNGITYAQSSSFINGIRSNPADRQYAFETWNALLPPESKIPLRSVPAEVATARNSLRQKFGSQVQFLNRVLVLKSSQFPVSADLQSRLSGYELTAQNNVVYLKEAVKTCYDDLTNPADPAQVSACVSAASDSALAAKGYNSSMTLFRLQDIQYSGTLASTPYFSTDYTAVIIWNTNKATTTQLQYRLVSNTSTPNPWIATPVDASLTTSHTVRLTNLDPVQRYEFQLLGSDQDGLKGVSAVSSFSTPKGNYDVGILPAVASCPGQTAPVEIYLDNEDNDNANGRGGWIGATISDRNTRFRFCRVNGLKFRPLVTSLLTNYEYAVLKLGSTCPNGSTEFYRFFDNEDNNQASSMVGDVAPNFRDSNGNTGMYFCMFRYGSQTMSVFPDFKQSYGVFAPNDFARAIVRGWVNTDDEDRNNKNGYSSPYASESQRIVSSGSNTSLNLSQVR
ncbi:hypothetical protein JQX13_31555 [Archangium violaceum]|uniref:hypothetical protein n=1 Tax=Archangium violaceum TaxID=83451 RepID=UPI00193C2D85|nr:hypothetical protein [Archangium violaceum]QRK04746.1 hypothetical protein JQX13_31555 [Archangium violaceum]